MNQLVLFAKFWRPGRVKTRLAATIGDVRASRLHRCFVETLVSRFADVADRRLLAFSPPERRAEFASITPAAWQLIPQAAGDLGRRMQACFATQLKRPEDRMVLIGSDSPTLPLEYLEAAFSALDQQPLVLGPTHDGGYYLVGATGRVPPIFDGIDWSTPAVWRQTIDCLRAVNCPFEQLPQWYDIDHLPDLRQAAAELERLAPTDPVWSSLSAEVQEALVGVA